jgi:hypothetical protein
LLASSHDERQQIISTALRAQRLEKIGANNPGGAEGNNMTMRSDFRRLIAGSARAVALIGIMAAALPASAQPVQWTGNGHWYEAVLAPGTLTWIGARDAAAAKGGYLATITSAAENDFVYSLVNDDRYFRVMSQISANNYYIAGPWFGGNNFSGSWKWVNNDTFSYSNWLPGQPDDPGNNSGTLFIGTGATVANRTAMWDDVPSDGGWWAGMTFPGYIVEYNSVPEPSAFSLLSLGGLLIAGRRAMGRRTS